MNKQKLRDIVNIYNLGSVHGHTASTSVDEFFVKMMHLLYDEEKNTPVIALTNPLQTKERKYLSTLGFKETYYNHHNGIRLHYSVVSNILDYGEKERLQKFLEKMKDLGDIYDVKEGDEIASINSKTVSLGKCKRVVTLDTSASYSSYSSSKIYREDYQSYIGVIYNKEPYRSESSSVCKLLPEY